MPDTEIRDLKQDTIEIVGCPVLMDRDGEIENCGMELNVLVTKTIRGDDYGSWVEYQVGFPCGHTFKDMERALKYEEFM